MGATVGVSGGVGGGVGALWMQVADDIAARIRAGEWPPGTRIPSVRALAAEYQARMGVGKSTVRDALTYLRDVGVLATRQGSGTSVASVPDGGVLPSRRPTLGELAAEVSRLAGVVDELRRDSHRHD